MGRVGRPSSASHETVVVRHRLSGETVAWSDAQFAGDAALRDVAREISSSRAVRFGPVMVAMDGSPRAAAVAMLSACGGHGELVSNPAVLTACSNAVTPTYDV